MNLMAILIQLASGALGGNIAGAMLGRFGLGGIGNTIVGIVGGGLGAQVLWLLGIWVRGVASAPVLDLGAIFWSIAGGLMGGGILMLLVGGIRMITAKESRTARP
ncbi:MAG TPA: hypothetical protein VFQ07_07310 [Candidatus Polarisedimenticolia bacterium]|nr:hypothetical protein [Candidatus Polarisedimenticolia bacterium]